MKKHRFRKWAVVSVLIGIFLVIGATQIFASPGTTVSVPGASAYPGGTVTVPININEVTDLGSANIWLHYNTDVVIVDSVAAGDLTPLFASIDNSAGVTKMVWFSATGQTGDFIFANVTLHAVGNHGDMSDLDLTVQSLVNIFDQPIPHSVGDGIFTIKALMEGDTSLNGCVTVSDAMLIAQWLVHAIDLSDDQLECADTTDENTVSPPVPPPPPNWETRVSIADAEHIAQWLVDPNNDFGARPYGPLWESPLDDHMALPDDCIPD